jgi:cell division protease FtsH
MKPNAEQPAAPEESKPKASEAKPGSKADAKPDGKDDLKTLSLPELEKKLESSPRGLGALGYTMQTPLEDRYLMSRSELLGKIQGLLGGRAAEELVLGDISTGASNDLEKSTKIAKDMITIYGMSTGAPNISFVERNEGRFLGQGPFIARRSEKIEQIIDDEIIATVQSCYVQSKKLISEHRDQLEQLATALLEKENIDEQDIARILGPPPENENAGQQRRPPA